MEPSSTTRIVRLFTPPHSNTCQRRPVTPAVWPLLTTISQMQMPDAMHAASLHASTECLLHRPPTTHSKCRHNTLAVCSYNGAARSIAKRALEGRSVKARNPAARPDGPPMSWRRQLKLSPWSWQTRRFSALLRTRGCLLKRLTNCNSHCLQQRTRCRSC